MISMGNKDLLLFVSWKDFCWNVEEFFYLRLK